MCDPLTIAATALMATGQAVSALQAAGMERYQAKVATRNAALENEAARNAQDRTRLEAQRAYRKIGQIKGAQVAAMAANGIDSSFGSAALVQQDTATLANEDVRQLYQSGFEEARGFEINAANYRSKASAHRQAAKAKIVEGAFDVANTVLGGVKQYNGLKSSRAGAG